MTDRTVVRMMRSIVAVGAILAISGSAVTLAAGEVGYWWRSYGPLLTIFTVGMAAFVWLVVPLQPRNAAVWVMAASACGGITVAGFALAARLADGATADLLEANWNPAAASSAVAWTLAVSNGLSVLALLLPLTLGLLLFPDGTLPSPRWRWVGVGGATSVVVFSAAHGLWFRPGNVGGDEGVALYVGLLGTFAAMALSLVGLLLRFRASSGATRQQFKWIVYGAVVCVPALIAPGLLPDSVDATDAVVPAVTLAVSLFAISYGIAVGRYRLYDVDVVISRTVVFTALAVMIGAVYVTVVVGVGSAFGGSSLWSSVVATGIIAVAFEPARARGQRWANRLVYGAKADPYEVLAGVADQLAASESTERLLDRLAQDLCDGTGTERAVVWVADDGVFRPVATAPEGAAEPMATRAIGELPGTAVPIAHHGEMLGALSLEARPGVMLDGSRTRLAEDLASSAALVVHKLRLEEALSTKAAELADSRCRLLSAQDDERRRLQRVLREGVEREVVDLHARLGAAHRLAVEEGSGSATALIDEMEHDAAVAIGQIRSMAQGLYPPRLDAEGLDSAICELADLCPLEVHTSVEMRHDHLRVAEGAVYFCVSEALTNASKYATGPVEVSVDDRGGGLSFSVTDAGPGFDPLRRDRGAGLDNMSDRLETLGGRLRVRSTVGGPTKVSGAVPPTTAAPRSGHDSVRGSVRASATADHAALT